MTVSKKSVLLLLCFVVFSDFCAGFQFLGAKGDGKCEGKRSSAAKNSGSQLISNEVVEKSRQKEYRGVRNIDPLVALMVLLQVKVLLALPLLLLAAGVVGLPTLAAGLVAAVFSGASLLRSLLTPAAAASSRPGSSSRVAYEVRTPPALSPADPYFAYPPSAIGAAPLAYSRQPDVRVISAASNN